MSIINDEVSIDRDPHSGIRFRKKIILPSRKHLSLPRLTRSKKGCAQPHQAKKHGASGPQLGPGASVTPDECFLYLAFGRRETKRRQRII